MLSLLEAITLGFIVGLSGVTFPGPVFVYIFQQSLTGGFKSGFWAIVAHALVGLTALMLIIMTGTATLFGSPAFNFYIGLVGGFSLIILGLFISVNSLSRNQTVQLRGKIPHYRHPFIGGLIVSVSNPQFFLWWAVIGLPSVGLANNLSGNIGIYGWTIGILMSLFIWYGGISFLASHGKKHIPFGVVLLISLVSGFFLIISGMYLLAKYFLTIM